MALTYAQGQFALNTGTGDQTVDTGSGVEGKALILFGTYQTASGFSAFQSGFVSFCRSSTSRKCLSWASDDNVATTNTGAGLPDLAITIYSAGTPTVDIAADFVSFGTGGDAGKFTINISNAGTAAIVHYIMLGGSDLTNVFVGQFAANTGTGNRDDTGVGFQGDLAIFLTRSSTSASNLAGLACGIGAARSSSQRGSMWFGARDAKGTGAVEKHYRDSTKCVAFPGSSGQALDAVADFVNFISDGYTLNWTDAAASAWLYGVMVLKGISADVDLFLCPASTGTQKITTPFSMTDGGVLFFGTGQTTANATVGDECHVCVGAMGESAINEEHIWTSEDDVVNTDANSHNDAAACVFVATNPSTVAASAAGSSLDSDGYTINWDTVRENSAFFGVAFAPAPPAGFPTELFREEAPPLPPPPEEPRFFQRALMALFPPEEEFPASLLRRFPRITEVPFPLPSVVRFPASLFAPEEAPEFDVSFFRRLARDLGVERESLPSRFRGLSPSLFEPPAPEFPAELFRRLARLAEEPDRLPNALRSLAPIIAFAPVEFPPELLRRVARLIEREILPPGVVRAFAPLLVPPPAQPFPPEFFRPSRAVVEEPPGVFRTFVPSIDVILAPESLGGTIKVATIPGGVLGVDGILRIELWFDRTVGSSNYRPRIVYGGTEVLAFASSAADLQHVEGFLFSAGTTLSQRAYGDRDGTLATGSAAVDSTLDQLLEVVIEKDSVGSTVKCDYFTIDRL